MTDALDNIRNIRALPALGRCPFTPESYVPLSFHQDGTL